MKLLENRVAIITGAARGIGESAAYKFAEEGAIVIVVDIEEKLGKEVVQGIEKSGGKAAFFKVDVSNAEEVSALVDSVIKEYGKIDVLYNNASIFHQKDADVVNLDIDIWDKTMAVNVKSVFLMCKYVIPHMIKQNKGSIINTSSSCGLIGIPDCDAYSASKGATTQITRTMAVEYGQYNIRVNCVAPAAILTPMLKISNLNNVVFDEERFLKLRSPLRRYGQPEEVADVAVYLASDKSSFLNGVIIPVEGGITINGDLKKIDKDYT